MKESNPEKYDSGKIAPESFVCFTLTNQDCTRDFSETYRELLRPILSRHYVAPSLRTKGLGLEGPGWRFSNIDGESVEGMKSN